MPSREEAAAGDACLAESNLPLRNRWASRQIFQDGCCNTSSLGPRHLLVVFVAGSSPAEQAAVLRSAHGLVEAMAVPRLTTTLAFHVLTYDGNSRHWGASPRTITGGGRSRRLESLLYVTDASLHNAQVYTPKFAIIALAQEHLHGVHSGPARPDAVWLPDADMDFTGFAALRFFSRWQCAWPGLAPPLISQPTIRGPTSAPTQLWWPIHEGSWLAGGPFHVEGRPPTALLSDFVEMQAPLFDAAFFAWFFRGPGSLIAGMNVAQGHGWGIDNVWCGAALTFANGTARPHCAIIPTPLKHTDTKSTRRDPEAVGKGEHSVRLTCLLARRAAQLAGATASWVSDPKATGYFGPEGYGPGGDPEGVKGRLRDTLLDTASYRVAQRCERNAKKKRLGMRLGASVGARRIASESDPQVRRARLRKLALGLGGPAVAWSSSRMDRDRPGQREQVYGVEPGER